MRKRSLLVACCRFISRATAHRQGAQRQHAAEHELRAPRRSQRPRCSLHRPLAAQRRRLLQQQRGDRAPRGHEELTSTEIGYAIPMRHSYWAALDRLMTSSGRSRTVVLATFSPVHFEGNTITTNPPCARGRSPTSRGEKELRDLKKELGEPCLRAGRSHEGEERQREWREGRGARHDEARRGWM